MFLSKFLKHTRAKALIALAGLTMVFGVGAAVSTVAATQQNEVVETKAASVPSGIYVDISDCQWNDWGATLSNIKAHFFTGSTGYTTWPGTAVTSVTVNGTTYGYVVVPSKATQCIFNAWGGDTNQNKTGDLTIPTDGKVLFKVTSHNTSAVQTGSWSDLDYYQSSSSPSTSTTRLFFYNSNTKWKDETCAFRAWGGTAGSYQSRVVSATLYALSWFGDETGSWYGYADLPQNVTGLQIVALNGSNVPQTYSTSEFTIATAANRVLYGSNDDRSISAGGAHDDAAGPTLMAKVLASINTCNNNAYSGYKAYSSLNTYFYSHATAAAKTSTCLSLGSSTPYTVDKHFEMLQKRDAANSAVNSVNIVPGPSRDQSPLTLTLWIVLASGAAGLSAIGAAYFISKRKKRNRA